MSQEKDNSQLILLSSIITLEMESQVECNALWDKFCCCRSPGYSKLADNLHSVHNIHAIHCKKIVKLAWHAKHIPVITTSSKESTLPPSGQNSFPHLNV